MITVKICGVPYTITREEDRLRVDHEASGMKLWGQISYDKRSIKYLACSPEQEMRTVLHEILHGIIENGSIRELMDDNGDHLEPPINQLANGLAESLESMGILLPPNAIGDGPGAASCARSLSTDGLCSTDEAEK